MIRFECETCGRALRAPLELAGKRGRCSQCGTANRVPAQPGLSPRRAANKSPVNVAVKRATGTSPFRTTADVALAPATAGTFVGATGTPGALGTPGGVAVLADPPRLADELGRSDDPADDFLGALSKRLGGADEADAGGELLAELEAAPIPAPRRRPAPAGGEGVRLSAALPMRHGPVDPVAPPADRAGLRGVLFGVLLVGIAIGFLAGLMAAKAFW